MRKTLSYVNQFRTYSHRILRVGRFNRNDVKKHYLGRYLLDMTGTSSLFLITPTNVEVMIKNIVIRFIQLISANSRNTL